MSVRQEDGPKNSSSSRGLGIAAAAIGVGVGVGAALYYFFGKRPENPDSAGSTSHWEIEQPDAFGSDGDADNSDWEEMTSDDLPRRFSYVRPNVFSALTDLIGVRRRSRRSRERSWTLEECTICYEVILKNQEVMSLPCTHNFHTACIMPWLQQQQTCPNCRTSVN
ncbi:E3 ubiquitin ligase BIG BROTHER-related-like isoform X2 [Colias croceus]|uniref:E3 ubiquitin ligase BIG BROTHER-related-like isoform X2 n=1 Tax=Colias crocea TaxID=72248 RepID=UPI001E27B640|nr:E3 ubiquitin ligase BIG BROTHER-related-like isoform X2 [Colias croceus]